jgi:hypothetical protein
MGSFQDADCVLDVLPGGGIGLAFMLILEARLVELEGEQARTKMG